MKSFFQWLAEDVGGQTNSNYQNGELYQGEVGSKYLATVNTKVKVPKTAECKYVGNCPKKPRERVNLLPVEV
jgi:hypothetical protein